MYTIVNYFYSIVLLVCYIGTAQNDTIPKIIFSEGNNGFEINAKLNSKNISFNENDEQDLSYLFYTKEKPLSISYKFNPKKYLDPNAKNINFMQGVKPYDDNVIVVKHFNGINKTSSKMKTTQSLGTIESNTEFIRIEYRDHGLVDGDRVRVFLNEKEVDSNVHLDGLFYTLHIKLEEQGYNKIDIQAINQGYAGPNTAEFIIYDDRGKIIAHKSWNLLKGENATLGVIKF